MVRSSILPFSGKAWRCVRPLSYCGHGEKTPRGLVLWPFGGDEGGNDRIEAALKQAGGQPTQTATRGLPTNQVVVYGRQDVDVLEYLHTGFPKTSRRRPTYWAKALIGGYGMVNPRIRLVMTDDDPLILGWQSPDSLPLVHIRKIRYCKYCEACPIASLETQGRLRIMGTTFSGIRSTMGHIGGLYCMK